MRKELSDNFCLHQPRYDSLDGAPDWARATLAAHASRPRDYVYSVRAVRARRETHDEAWNAAQRQMTRTGKMHGYMRMYWAKKILEWTPSAASAIDIAVRLNDFYEIDGGDPNGYVGVMWSIAGRARPAVGGAAGVRAGPVHERCRPAAQVPHRRVHRPVPGVAAVFRGENRDPQPPSLSTDRRLSARRGRRSAGLVAPVREIPGCSVSRLGRRRRWAADVGAVARAALPAAASRHLRRCGSASIDHSAWCVAALALRGAGCVESSRSAGSARRPYSASTVCRDTPVELTVLDDVQAPARRDLVVRPVAARRCRSCPRSCRLPVTRPERTVFDLARPTSSRLDAVVDRSTRCSTVMSRPSRRAAPYAHRPIRRWLGVALSRRC